MRILLVGADGQIGRCIQELFLQDGKVQLLALGRNGLDIGDSDAVAAVAAEFVPDIIINAAAYTAVDKAESQQESAQQVNTKGALNLALAASRIDALLIYLSTDYVFDGEKGAPYLESDQVNPLSIYAKTKLSGERSVQRLCRRYVVLRTAWVFSEYGSNFVKTMLRLGSSRDELVVVADQFGCPTYARDLARACLAICRAEANQQCAYGLFHYAGNRVMSWHDFSQAIFRVASEMNLLNPIPALRGIKSNEYPAAAVRPKNSALTSQKFIDHYHVEASDPLVGLRTVITRLAQTGAVDEWTF